MAHRNHSGEGLPAHKVSLMSTDGTESHGFWGKAGQKTIRHYGDGDILTGMDSRLLAEMPNSASNGRV
jgi:hypothetical protein